MSALAITVSLPKAVVADKPVIESILFVTKDILPKELVAEIPVIATLAAADTDSSPRVPTDAEPETPVTAAPIVIALPKAEVPVLPVTEVLENVKKSHANKYTKAVTALESICEGNTGWLKEQK